MPSYILDNAFMDIYCFPYYTYGILLLLSMLIQFIFMKRYDVYEQVNKDQGTDKNGKNQIVIDFINKNKKSIAEYLNVYSPLPQNIINIIVNEMLEDADIKSALLQELETKKNVLCKYFNGYLFIANVAYFVCFILVLWINIEWISDNNINGWYGFQSLVLTMMMYHPFSKIIILIIIMTDNDDNKEVFDFVRYSMIFNAILVGILNTSGYLVFGLPSVFYYIVIWIIYAIFVFLYIFILFKLEGDDDKDNGASNTTMWCVMVPVLIVYLFFMYGCIIYAMVSMSCIYSKDLKGHGQWYNCLYQSLFSPHCPNVNLIHVQWKDWRAIFFLVSWLLF